MEININSLIHFWKKACLVMLIKKIVTKQKVSMRQNSAKSYYKLYPKRKVVFLTYIVENMINFIIAIWKELLHLFMSKTCLCAECL